MSAFHINDDGAKRRGWKLNFVQLWTLLRTSRDWCRLCWKTKNFSCSGSRLSDLHLNDLHLNDLDLNDLLLGELYLSDACQTQTLPESWISICEWKEKYNFSRKLFSIPSLSAKKSLHAAINNKSRGFERSDSKTYEKTIKSSEYGVLSCYNLRRSSSRASHANQ